MKFLAWTAYLWVGMAVGAVFQLPLHLINGNKAAAVVQATCLAIAGPLAWLGLAARKIKQS